MTTQEPEKQEGEGGEEEGRGKKRWHHLPKPEVARARVCVMPDTVRDPAALYQPSQVPIQTHAGRGQPSAGTGKADKNNELFG